MSELTASSALARFKELGCAQVFIKKLSTKQDNEKNQIYLGTKLEIFSVLPGLVTIGTSSESTEKRKSAVGEPKLERDLDFYWITKSGEAKAPNAKIINYFQYPEIRLSGFLSDCEEAPIALRRNRQGEFGTRVLIFGSSAEKVFALVLTTLENGDLSALIEAPAWLNQKLLKTLTLDNESPAVIDPTLLIAEIKQICGQEQQSQSLGKRDAAPKPWRGTQGAGYTLEALLGVRRNGTAAPDKYGFEIKSTLSSPITLITTEPDGGVRHSAGLKVFLARFGWMGSKDDGSFRFNGKHSPVFSTHKSELDLKVTNWNKKENLPDGDSPPVVELRDRKTKTIAASWSFDKIGGNWSKKHAGAIFVEAIALNNDSKKHPSHYIFGPRFYVCTGTSALKLFQAIADGTVYLDSGDRLDASGKAKSRTQWRMAFSKKNSLESQLRKLYEKVEIVDV